MGIKKQGLNCHLASTHQASVCSVDILAQTLRKLQELCMCVGWDTMHGPMSQGMGVCGLQVAPNTALLTFTVQEPQNDCPQ